ncbi:MULTISPECIES: branched-chain amino acid ABC transporter permease [Candidatus Ichthyocystis]|uniref:branched-chain amino acid ABC transporter permease n=1 Tax=Candidatus Ichthyocystis TaxID=2929841 RepID=UPI000A8B91E9|nr:MULTISPECIES: branched-chain amino acid ABC transporter permease [Ichthyocystis]
MNFFTDLFVDGLFVGSTYAILALGYSMVYGVLGLINFAHGDVLMIGTFVCYSAINILEHYLPSTSHGIILVVATSISMIISGITGALLELVAYRRVRKASSLICLTTAIGASIVIQSIAMIIWGRQYLKFPQYIPMHMIHFWKISAPFSHITTIAVTTVTMLLLWLFVRKTRIGLSIRAVSEHDMVAELMGINSNAVISITFIMGSALAALGGILLASNYGIINYGMGFVPGIKAFTAAVIGGIGSIPGSMVGGMLLGVVEALVTGYITDWTGGILNSDYQNVFSFIILLTVLLVRPNGLLGTSNTDKS